MTISAKLVYSAFSPDKESLKPTETGKIFTELMRMTAIENQAAHCIHNGDLRQAVICYDVLAQHLAVLAGTFGYELKRKGVN